MSEPVNSPRAKAAAKAMAAIPRTSTISGRSSSSLRSLPTPSSSTAPPSFPSLSHGTQNSSTTSTAASSPYALPPGYTLVPYDFQAGPSSLPRARPRSRREQDAVPRVASGSALYTPPRAYEGAESPQRAWSPFSHAHDYNGYDYAPTAGANVAETNPLAVVPYVPQPPSPVLAVVLRPTLPIATTVLSAFPSPRFEQAPYHLPSPPSLPPLSPGVNPWDKSDDEDEVESPRLVARKNYDFNVFVTMRFVETVQQPNGKPRTKTAKLTLTVQATILQLSRTQFITMFLKAHDASTLYKITLDGPPFSISLGSNSKSLASSVRTDNHFIAAVKPLLESRIKSVTVEFETAAWKPWLTALATITNNNVPPGAAPSAQDTAVASQGFFSSKDGQVAAKMIVLREKYWCARHGEACYRELDVPNSPHHVMLNVQLKIMAQDVVWNRCTEDCPTPAFLRSLKAITSRGRKDDVPSGSSKRCHSPSPSLRSSPPPGALDDHLHAALNACSEQHPHISVTELKAAYDALQGKGYVPHSFSSLTVEKVADLTGLPEGKAATLHAFCIKWAARMDGKWKKRRIGG